MFSNAMDSRKRGSRTAAILVCPATRRIKPSNNDAIPMTHNRLASKPGTPPVVATDPDGEPAKAYCGIAAKAWAELERHKDADRPAPKIVMEN